MALSTTALASRVAGTIDGVVPGLSVTRIDPALEVRKYTLEVLAKAGAQLADTVARLGPPLGRPVWSR